MLFMHYRKNVGTSIVLLIMLPIFLQLSCDSNKTALEECRREADSLRADMQVLLDSLSKPMDWQHSVFEGPIKLFYFNSDSARAYGGLHKIYGHEAVLPIERTLGPTRTPIEDAIDLWIAGELTEEEKAAGFIASHFDSLRLERSVLHNGILCLEFYDPKYETSGGSTRVLIWRSQITKTALQFRQVRGVEVLGEEFQP